MSAEQIHQAPWWDFRRGGDGARAVVGMALDEGVSEQQCFQGTALTASALSDSGVEVEAIDELRIVRNVLAELGDRPGLGVRAGQRSTLTSVGIVGFALLSSQTLRDASGVAIRNLAATACFVRLSIEEDGTRAQLVLDDEEIPADVRDFLVERDLTSIGQVLRGLLGEDVAQTALRVHLRMARERGSALAAALPGQAEFGQPRNALSFPVELVDAPLAHADSTTAQMSEQQCRELIESRQERRGVAAEVRSRLLHDPRRPAPIEVIAAERHITERTLRRHLAKEGTSYRALLDEVRDTLAVAMLTTAGLTVAEVAARLGYSEPASFTHAFQRWHGVPPSEYRR
jgi:AraC-like DNA-binding protein